MRSYKIIVSGPFNAGKTTFIRTLCEEYIDTDKKLLKPLGEKTKTTVALDFGVVSFDNKSVRLFGTPGQKSFYFMWEVLSKKLDGYILLVDSEDVEALNEAEDLYRFFKIMIPEIPHAIGLNKYNRPGFKMEPRDVVMALSVPPSVPVLKVDARNYDSALNLVKTVVKLIDERRRRLENEVI